MNRGEHTTGGIILGGLIGLLFSPNSTHLLVLVLTAIIGSWMPDILEPPTWPGHRGIFHYLGGPLAGAIVIFSLSPSATSYILGTAAGYFSHFVLDYIW